MDIFSVSKNKVIFEKKDKFYLSAVVLFGDLQRACYSVLVELVTGPLLTPEERRAVLENTGMDELRRLTLEVDLSQGHWLCDHLPLPQDLKVAVREW